MHNRTLPISTQVLLNAEPIVQIRVGLAAAEWAFSFWARALPEMEAQQPLRRALKLVRDFCATQVVPEDAKDIGVAAYQCVSSCDLPRGDILRSAGFSVAHISMTPWFFKTSELSQLQNSAKVSINYAESLAMWSGKMNGFLGALQLPKDTHNGA